MTYRTLIIAGAKASQYGYERDVKTFDAAATLAHLYSPEAPVKDGSIVVTGQVADFIRGLIKAFGSTN